MPTVKTGLMTAALCVLLAFFAAACGEVPIAPPPGDDDPLGSSSAGSVSGDSSSSVSSNSVSNSSSGYSASPPASLGSYDRSTHLRIGSMNMQVFGPTKLGRPNLVTLMASVATNFDIIALQEVGSNQANVNEINASSAASRYTQRVNEIVVENNLSAELGTYAFVQGNQYAYVYRTAAVSLSDTYGYTNVQYAATNSFSYPPLLTKATTTSGLCFVLFTVHTSPGSATSEIPAIAVSMLEAASKYNEPRVIALGDYNADGSYYSPGSAGQGWLNGFPLDTWWTCIPNGADTTVASSNNTYDRVQMLLPLKPHFTGKWGVVRYSQYYDISIVEGTGNNAGTENAISDHYPVWIELQTGL